VLQTIAAGTSAGFLALSPDGSRLYQSNGSVAVIDTASNAVLTTLYAGAYTSGIAVSPDGARLYVANTIYNFSPVFSASGGVTVFDTATGATVASINTWYLPEHGRALARRFALVTSRSLGSGPTPATERASCRRAG